MDGEVDPNDERTDNQCYETRVETYADRMARQQTLLAAPNFAAEKRARPGRDTCCTIRDRFEMLTPQL
jgi:hypothetical protein